MAGKSPVTTHVLDTMRGAPAMGVPVRLEKQTSPGSWQLIGKAVTDSDGRAASLLPPDWAFEPGVYRLTFDTAAYFKTLERLSFYPHVEIVFEARERAHYHVPLLLAPYGYSTYRGS